MIKSLLKKASVICLLSLLFVMKGNAVNADWYCDYHNGTYSIMDLSAYKLNWLTDGCPMDVLLGSNPYHFWMPRNIASGELVTAHFKAKCVGANAVKEYEIIANVKDHQGNPLVYESIKTKSKNWSDDHAFLVDESAEWMDFVYRKNGNTKAKEVMFWMPMPVHLDVDDQDFEQPVELGESVDFFIPMNTFFLEGSNPNITIINTNDPDLDCGDFTIIRGTVTPANRCGTFRWVDHSQRKYFADTRLACNQFVVRFTPTHEGESECEFRVENGSQSKVIRIKAHAIKRYVKFVTVGEGAVELYVNNDPTPKASPYEFQKGDHLRFVAVASECSHFVNWSINPFHHFPVIDVIGNHSFVLHANFAPNMLHVCAAPSDPSEGRVFFDNNPHHHFCGARVLFVAQPAPDYVFTGWSPCDNPDSIVSTEDHYYAELTDNLCLKANFSNLNDCFHIICETSNGINVHYNSNTAGPDPELLYSINGADFEEYVLGTDIHVDNKGDIIYMKAKTTNTGVYNKLCDWRVSEADVVPALYISDTASVAGNIMYLLDNTGATTTLNKKSFQTIFASNKILNANELVLPATTLTEFAYHGMFRNCSTLISVPALPATEISARCYSYMFMNCPLLNEVPELPADSVPSQAYEGMFYGCSSLTAAPELNASIIDDQAYRMMFQGCSSLTDVQDTLPALVAPYATYEMMFKGCTSLETAPEILATTLEGQNSMRLMFDSCVNLTKAPTILPALTVGIASYMRMFQNCISLETAPVLPATTLDAYCYRSMFEGCSSLSRIEVGFTGWGTSPNYSTYTKDWTKGVPTDGGVFICPTDLEDKRNTTTKFQWIPTNWAVNPDPQPSAPRMSEVEYVVAAEGMNIIVNGAADAMVSVYDAAGRLISTISKATDFETISIATPGVYVVTVSGQESTRVIVK